MRRNGALTLLAVFLAAGCSKQTAGSSFRVDFSVAGLQRPDGGPLFFTTALGWDVELDAAKIDLGPFYFNIDPPEQGQFRSGVVIAESLLQVTVDTLNPRVIPVLGGVNGITGGTVDPAVAVEIDLLPPGDTIVDPDVGGPNNNASAYLAGVATKAGVVVPFRGWLVIDANLASVDDPLPWIQRVNGALCDLSFTTDGGLLTLQVDPTTWFDGSDFSTLLPADAATADGGPYGWTDVSAFAGTVLNGIQNTTGVYTFQLSTP